MTMAMRGMWMTGELGLGAPSIRAMMHLRRAFIDRMHPRWFRGYEARPKDLLVCTHAKSGTNWLLQMGVQLAHLGDARFDHIHHLVPWPDCPLPTVPLSLDVPPTSPTGWRVIKTHLDADHVPFSDVPRYVVVVRDPRDTLVSSFHFAHTCFRAIFEVQLTVDEWLEMHLAGLTPFDSWAMHTASWWARQQEEHVLFFRFEDLKQDLPGAVVQLERHMGLQLTDPQRSAVVEQCGFEHMRARNTAFAPPFNPIRDEGMCMIREGRVGSWSGVLSEELERRLMDHTRAELARLGSDFPLDAYYPTLG